MFSHKKSNTSEKASARGVKRVNMENTTLGLLWFLETMFARYFDLADLTTFWKTRRDSLKISNNTCRRSFSHLHSARL